MYDTIIIGAGMSGLAAGIRSAYYDQRVCILERHTTIGGLNSFYRHRGRNFDVGLHAVTNFTPKGTRKGPFARLLRQLRLRWDEFALSPQVGSSVAFPDVRLRFNNDPRFLESEIERCFPRQKDNFQRLLGKILDYDDIDQRAFSISARQVVGETIDDPLLIDMLFCPLMWYGNAREQDMDWGQFCIMFRSILLEGFARPLQGVRPILKMLVKKYRDLGGKLKLRCGVKNIEVSGRNAVGVTLDDGQEITGKRVLSSAGWAETMRMCQAEDQLKTSDTGQLTFVEAISVLDRPPSKLGHNDTIVFFNDSDTFSWEKSDDLCDVHTGVVCSPDNFVYGEADATKNADVGVNGAKANGKKATEGTVRITAIANFDQWASLSDEQYELEKCRWYDRIVASAARFVPDFRGHVIDTDVFTPKTIHRFTWHDKGAVYGSPQKRLDGTTHLKNLFICGTDQGFVGIIGAIVSGISMANRHLLREG